MAITRVYILAEELGVQSAAIVKKCQDEGLDVKNHMTAISVGLAATIREWFTEGENLTTVETAEKVNLEKVRVKRKPKAEKPLAEPEEPKAAVAEPAPAVAEAILQPPVVQVVEQQAPLAEVAQPVAEAPQAPAVQPEHIEEKIKPAPDKPKPEPIRPAGPMLEKPSPARLAGPQVVRVEAPEPLTQPRPRRRPKHETPITEPLMHRKTTIEKKDADLTAVKDRNPPVKRSKERARGQRRAEQDTESVRESRLRTKWRQRDIDERQARIVAAGGEGLRTRPTRKIATRTEREPGAPARPRKAVVTEPIVVKDLSAALGVKSSDIVGKLMGHGIMATANQIISSDVAELVALEFNTELMVEHKTFIEDQIRAEFEGCERNNLKRRPVVVAMLGHVDHGKTSLLDKIRSAQVAAGEAGGITQHIGAYQVSWDKKTVTLLDTPGHEAFTAMRARGANMTDIVVLTVAADDGVMPQTVEAIAHTKAAGVPTVVALNKIDLPGCDINRIYAQLAEQGLAPTEWGGQTEVVKTSATTGQGINDLLECLDYVAELLDLKADDTIPATGWVVEAKMSAQQGPAATLLVKEGKLTKGDVILAGGTYGRVKMIKDSYGKAIKEATSSMPVEVTGLSDVPQAGDRFYRLNDINRAKAAAEEHQNRSREKSLAGPTHVTLENLFTQIEAGKVKELNIIIRADVQGSVDVLTKYLSELSTSEVRINILQAAPGGITESDILLAEASNAIIIGFSVVPEERAAKMAESKGVEVRLYNIIYRITEELQKSMVGLLEPREQEEALGRAVVRAIFKVSRIGTVAGCYVTSGSVVKNAKARLIRDNIVIRDNMSIESLKHFKDDAREVKTGLECGIKIAGFDDIKTDDVLEFYEIVKVARVLQP